MSLTETKKSPLAAIPFLKKRLRRITALGLRNLTVIDFNFTVHFTLHRTDQTIAFYTSETIENQRSPEWWHLRFPSIVQCLQDFIMRIWISSVNHCRLFLEYDIHLDESLLPDEQKDDSARSENSLWLEMFGYRFTDNESVSNKANVLSLPDVVPSASDRRPASKRVQIPKSYSKSSIIRMMNVLQAIDKEKQVASLCLERLQTVADANEDYISKLRERESRQSRVSALREYVESQSSILERRLQLYEQQQQIIEERKGRLEQNLFKLLSQGEKLNSLIQNVKQSKYILNEFIQLTTYRQKEIVSEIYRHVYPIVNDEKNEYCIANAKLLPAEEKVHHHLSSNRDKANELATAIGFCAHFVLIISQFIQLPLRFPIEFYGTTTIKIHDYSLPSSDLSLDPTSKTNTFQYAFFLLNRNIGQIMDHCRVGNRNTDYRKTLENLKELMEKYFTQPITNPHPIQHRVSNLQSLGIPIPARQTSSADRSPIRSKRNSTLTPVFSSWRSSTSSLLESNDLHENGENPSEMELFSPSNTISPRLAMQFSVLPK